MELNARIARGDDQTASEARIFDAVESALLAPPRDANDHAAARPGEDGNAVRMFGLREAEGRCDLALARVEDQAGDLCVTVDRGQLGSGQRMEEVDAPVVAATAGSDEGGLPWCKGDRFAGGVQ